MPVLTTAIGTVVSDEDSPSFELVRLKLKVGQDVRPGTLVRIEVNRNGAPTTLIGRIRSAHEHNPNERPEDINVRETLGLAANYPGEEDSTTIYRIAEADLVEEIVGEDMVAPQTLPNAGAMVFIAQPEDVVRTLGLTTNYESGLDLGHTVGGTPVGIYLKREAIQRHLFICGTTGSGKSYAMGVVAEELVRHNLPVVFLDTQDEYANLVKKLGGEVVEPGKDFTIRISSLTESELIDLLPEAMQRSALQTDVVARAFADLQVELRSEDRPKFTLSDLIAKAKEVAPQLAAKEGDVPRLVDAVARRLGTLSSHRIFGIGHEKADWRRHMYPCLAINCKNLSSLQLQSVATAVLRELQDLRVRNHIPPYVVVVDEAHLFVPEGEDSACKQIIREGVRIGRHHGIAIVLMTQSPVDIDKRAIRQCNTRLVFALEPDQLDAIRGVKADATEEMLRSLPKMLRGTCLLSGTYESVKHTVPVKVRERRMEYSEGGETPDIFSEMESIWKDKINQLKQRRSGG